MSNQIPSPDAIRRTVWTLEWQSYGKDRGDADYWVSKWQELVDRGVEIGHPNYAEHRVMGMGAGGADAAVYGPYAVPPTPVYGVVPPYPGDSAPDPAPSPSPSPSPAPAPVDLSALLAKGDEILAAIKAASEANTAKLDELKRDVIHAAKNLTTVLPLIIGGLKR